MLQLDTANYLKKSNWIKSEFEDVQYFYHQYHGEREFFQ